MAATLAAVLLAGCSASVAGTSSTSASGSPSSSAAATVAGTTVEDVLDGDVEEETGDTYVLGGERTVTGKSNDGIVGKDGLPPGGGRCGPVRALP